MAIIQRKNVVGLGAVVVAALVLTGVGVLFNVLVPKGLSLALVLALIPLGIAVLAVLVGFNWVLDTFDGGSEVDRVRSVLSTRQADQMVGDSKRAGSAPNARDHLQWRHPDRWPAAKMDTR